MASDVILDFYPPTLTAPANLVVEATGTDGISRDDELISDFLDEFEASDLVDGALEECKDESVRTGCWWHYIPETLPVGIRPVTFRAADNAGNEADPVTAYIKVSTWVPINWTDVTFKYPQGVAVDGYGNVYVTDPGLKTVVKLTPDGKKDANFAPNVTFTWGIGGVAVDGYGNVYVADAFAGKVVKLTPEGVKDKNFPAGGVTFTQPSGAAVDGYGNVYVVDGGEDSTKAIELDPTVVKLDPEVKKDANFAPNVTFTNPWGVAVDGYGNVYVADAFAGKVVKLTPEGS